MEKLTIQNLEKFLKKDQFDCMLQQAGEGELFDSLIVYLGNDEQKRERFLKMTIKPQILSEKPFQDLSLNQEAKYCALEFYAECPFVVCDHAAADTARFVCFINRSCDLPGFEIDEIDGLICYRTVHFFQTESCDWSLIKNLLGSVIMFFNVYSSELEKIARGHCTFPELIESYLARVSKD